MNAVATNPRAKTQQPKLPTTMQHAAIEALPPESTAEVSRTPAKPDWHPLFVAVQAKVPPLLWAAHDRLDDSFCESAFRLTAIAARMIEEHKPEEVRHANGRDNDADNLVYDCLALIASAKGTKDQDDLDELSMSLLQIAQDMLHALMYAMTDMPGQAEVAPAHEAFGMNGGVL